MRASGSGPLGALLMLAPVVAVPLLAVFGIPQFTPVSASPTSDETVPAHDSFLQSVEPEIEVGESARHSADDLFAPLNTPGLAGRARSFDELAGSALPGSSANHFSDSAPQRGTGWRPAREALAGWEVQSEAGSSRELALADTPVAARNTEAVLADSFGTGAFRDSATELEDAPRFESEPTAASSEPRSRARGFTAEPADSAPFDSAPFDGAPFDSQPAASADSGANPFATDRSAGDYDLGHAPATASRARVSQDPAPRRTAGGQRPAQPTALRAQSPEARVSWQEAVQRLKVLGIRKHHFEYIESRNTFLFTCSLTPSDQPTVTQRFDAEAAEPLAAVGEVLAQIDDWLVSHHPTAAHPRSQPSGSARRVVGRQ